MEKDEELPELIVRRCDCGCDTVLFAIRRPAIKKVTGTDELVPVAYLPGGRVRELRAVHDEDIAGQGARAEGKEAVLNWTHLFLLLAGFVLGVLVGFTVGRARR